MPSEAAQPRLLLSRLPRPLPQASVPGGAAPVPHLEDQPSPSPISLGISGLSPPSILHPATRRIFPAPSLVSSSTPTFHSLLNPLPSALGPHPLRMLSSTLGCAPAPPHRPLWETRHCSNSLLPASLRFLLSRPPPASPGVTAWLSACAAASFPACL